ncbi:proline dehydrogenase [Batrachochytrium dendrobatidis]|nr:proline dehydrogenase [Batrachochytrium dendrobatidis]
MFPLRINSTAAFLATKPIHIYPRFLFRGRILTVESGQFLSSLKGSSRTLTQTASTSDDPFSDAAVRPYKTRTTPELINSMTVFTMCTMPGLVNAAPSMIETAHKLGVSAPLNALIKATFFKHFCGGENLNEVLPTMHAFQTAGIGSILDLAIEADLNAVSLSGAAAHDYAKNMVTNMKQSIDIASHQPESFIAVKITALFPPVLLQRWSNSLIHLKDAFCAADTDKDGLIDMKQFDSLKTTFPKLSEQSTHLFAAMDTDQDGKVDWMDLATAFSLLNVSNSRLLVVDQPTNKSSQLENQPATMDDCDTAELVMHEVDQLCEYTQLKNVKIMMDAEQTYFQPAIDNIVLGLCRKWNPSTIKQMTESERAAGSKGPLIFNTYQMYLCDAYSRLERDLNHSARMGYSFGVKLVRGAYMVSERERAAELGIKDPIQPTILDTHANYNRGVAFLIEKIKLAATNGSIKPISLVIASHNKDSVRAATKLMAKHGIAPNDGCIAFAQLMGMQDGTAYALVSHGFKTYKYIPYGPIEVTVPYLQRRAQENSSVIGGVGEDRRNVLSELKIRMGLLRAK